MNDSDCINLVWTQPRMFGNFQEYFLHVTQFPKEYQANNPSCKTERNFSNEYRTDEPTFTIFNSEPFTRYEMKVQARNVFFKGPFSDSYTCETDSSIKPNLKNHN